MATYNREALWEHGEDETVQVNQRALIDKVLARYSGEFTVFRELLQNSDDAASERVEIHFMTKDFQPSARGGSDGELGKASLPDLNRLIFDKWAFKNDGMVFREEDWNRLKKIAEGNPDEDKIGAFGVGFYSLFSVTEEPFVTSGDQWMGFYWKGDQLVARKGPLSEESESSPWTTFEMPLREPTPMPKAFNFVQFLCSSLTFMVKLREVSVFVNDVRLARVAKSVGEPRKLGLPKDLRTNSAVGIMSVNGIESRSLSITADIVRAVYTSFAEKPRANLPSATSGQTENAAATAKTSFLSSLFSSFKNSPATPAPATPADGAPPPPPVKEIDPSETLQSSIVLTVFSAKAGVKLDNKLRDELHRSTKKNPPKEVTYSLIYTGKDAYDASKREDEALLLKSGSIFQGLRADIEGAGSAKIFIGHATGQTTGVGGHMAARFIPTVERESIDMVDKNVSVWNRELLFVGGFLCRAVYELEMSNIRSMWPDSPITDTQDGPEAELKHKLQERAIYTMQFFSFSVSTPSAAVAHLLQGGFFSCALRPQNFPVISTKGILEVQNVRIFSETFAPFVKELPTIPSTLRPGLMWPRLLVELTGNGLLKYVEMPDVLKELRSRPLPADEMVACLKWWFELDKEELKDLRLQLRRQFLEAAVILFRNGDGPGQDRILPLTSVATFISPQMAGSSIPIDDSLPLPTDTFPYTISRQLPDAKLLESIFGWKPLTLPIWLQHLLKQTETFPLNEQNAMRVLQVLARSWTSLDYSTKQQVKEILEFKQIVPTREGVLIPKEAYFPSVDIFPDLPVITIPSKGKGMDQMLESLGVRKHVELQLIFSRMFRTGDWSTADLIKYLASIRNNLTPEEMSRLRQTRAFLAEDNSHTAEEKPSTGGKSSPEKGQDVKLKPEAGPSTSAMPQQKRVRHTAGELYEPLDTIRAVWLPVLDWGVGNRWRPGSNEAKFLFDIGLMKHPELAVILNLASTSNPDVEQRSRALSYFVENFSQLYKDSYVPAKYSNLEFIPAMEAGGTQFLSKIGDVFSNPEAGIFGFSVLSPQYREYADVFQIKEHPPTSHIMTLLRSHPPQHPAQANSWFEALTNRAHDFTPDEIGKLQNINFIPKVVQGPRGPRTSMYKPSECYMNNENAAKLHSEIFTFVDFSDKAGIFLRMCGVRDAPSTQEIAQILVKDPKGFLDRAGHRENFLAELRNLAVNEPRLPASIKNKMTKTPCMLGFRRHVSTGKGQAEKEDLEDEYDADWQYAHELAIPKQIAIVDDTATYTLFAELILSVPQEDLLESFYSKLGSPRLSTLIREEYQPSGLANDQNYAVELRNLVLSRLNLFLHEHSHSRTAVNHAWLSKEGNFIVQIARKVQLNKHLRFNGISASRSLEASAAATRTHRNGPITLSVAGEVDMYEVANTLLGLILTSHKVNDALLFCTILSTDLRALRRRGYNVDRILKQQRAEKEAREKAAKEVVGSGLDDRAPPTDNSNPLPPNPATGPPPYSPIKGAEATGFLGGFRKLMKKPSHSRMKSSDSSSEGKTPTLPPIPPTPPVSASLDSTSTSSSPAAPPPPPLHSRPPNISGLSSHLSRPNIPKPWAGLRPSPQGGTENTPANINHNVQNAVMACRPTNTGLIQNREQMSIVKEALDEGYCDVSGAKSNLAKIGQLHGLLIYVDREMSPNDQTGFISKQREPLERFIGILAPLSSCYGIPSDSLHVFYDLQGGLIAFNRSGSLFLNFRYYLAWHDWAVQHAKKDDAYISWFFTLAHEIAHNLVGPHNAEHEFYFSSICEKYMVGLCQLLMAEGEGSRLPPVTEESISEPQTEQRNSTDSVHDNPFEKTNRLLTWG